jgi:hypothetical protein
LSAVCLSKPERSVEDGTAAPPTGAERVVMWCRWGKMRALGFGSTTEVY